MNFSRIKIHKKKGKENFEEKPQENSGKKAMKEKVNKVRKHGKKLHAIYVRERPHKHDYIEDATKQ